MLLIPCLAAILLLGISPAGGFLADAVGRWLGVGSILSYLILYAGFIAIPAAVMQWIWRREPAADACPREDSWWETGSGRGQHFFYWLLVFSFPFVIGALWYNPAGILCLSLITAAASLAMLSLSIRRSTWPPPMEPFEISEPIVLPEPGDPPDPDAVEITYYWSYTPSESLNSKEQQQESLQLRIKKSTYEKFKSLPHERSDESFGKYVLDGITPEVSICAAKLQVLGIQSRQQRLEFVSYVLSFVRHAFDYAYDEKTHDTKDYWNFPIETLMEKKGDCEDHGILAAALLRELGFEALLIRAHFSDSDHIAVGLPVDDDLPFEAYEYQGRRYYYCEATGEGDWKIGEIPSGFKAELQKSTVIPLKRSEQRVA